MSFNLLFVSRIISMVKKENPNMRTKAWGPPAWFFMTCVAMGYPSKNPTKLQKSYYRNFFKYVGKTLPCSLCRTSFAKFTKELPLTDKVLSSRRSLVIWLFKIHNKVNKKLKCKVLNKHDMDKKYKWYNQFRATTCSKKVGGCINAEKSVKKPLRTKIVTLIDKQALKNRKKDMQKKRRPLTRRRRRPLTGRRRRPLTRRRRPLTRRRRLIRGPGIRRTGINIPRVTGRW